MALLHILRQSYMFQVHQKNNVILTAIAIGVSMTFWFGVY